MIYTKKQNISRYLGLNPSLDTAIQYLQTADLSKLHKGHNSISGDNVFVNRFDYETIPEYEGSWEGHVRYGDIHIMISGNEKSLASNARMTQGIINQYVVPQWRTLRKWMLIAQSGQHSLWLDRYKNPLRSTAHGIPHAAVDSWLNYPPLMLLAQ